MQEALLTPMTPAAQTPDGSDALAPKDASGQCHRRAPFASIVRLGGNVNTPKHEYYPRVSSNELSLYFERFDPENLSRSFFRAQRDGPQDAFDAHDVQGLPENPCAPFVTGGDSLRRGCRRQGSGGGLERHVFPLLVTEWREDRVVRRAGRPAASRRAARPARRAAQPQAS
jgi:hypothetical protein